MKTRCSRTAWPPACLSLLPPARPAADPPAHSAKRDRPDERRIARLGHLTLDDAIDIALHRNPAILNQLQEIQRNFGMLITGARRRPAATRRQRQLPADRPHLLESADGATGSEQLHGGAARMQPARPAAHLDVNPASSGAAGILPLNQLVRRRQSDAGGPELYRDAGGPAGDLQRGHPAGDPAGALPARRRVLRPARDRRYHGQHGQDGFLHRALRQGEHRQSERKPAPAPEPAHRPAEPVCRRHGAALRRAPGQRRRGRPAAERHHRRRTLTTSLTSRWPAPWASSTARRRNARRRSSSSATSITIRRISRPTRAWPQARPTAPSSSNMRLDILADIEAIRVAAAGLPADAGRHGRPRSRRTTRSPTTSATR